MDISVVSRFSVLTVLHVHPGLLALLFLLCGQVPLGLSLPQGEGRARWCLVRCGRPCNCIQESIGFSSLYLS